MLDLCKRAGVTPIWLMEDFGNASKYFNFQELSSGKFFALFNVHSQRVRNSPEKLLNDIDPGFENEQRASYISSSAEE